MSMQLLTEAPKGSQIPWSCCDKQLGSPDTGTGNQTPTLGKTSTSSHLPNHLSSPCTEFSAVLRIQPRPLLTPGEHSTSEPHLSPNDKDSSPNTDLEFLG